jgi:uncharacterized membrane protein
VLLFPLGLPFVLLLGLLLALFVLLVELRILAYAYRKIGVQPRYVFAVMLLTLIGSGVDIPLYSLPSTRATRISSSDPSHPPSHAQSRAALGRRRGTVVAVNVGGALIPALISLYLFLRFGMHARMLLATALVALVVHQMARLVPGSGIVVPMLLPPILAAGAALLLAFRRAPPVAYVAGSMGTLIGADLMNLARVAELGTPMVSIGGAGTFDGVFLTGIIAGLLA